MQTSKTTEGKPYPIGKPGGVAQYQPESARTPTRPNYVQPNLRVL